jgi:hypothetical protein
MAAWLKMRDLTGEWTEVSYENVVADTSREMQRTLAALEVPWNESILQYRSHATETAVRSPSYEEVARPIFTSSIGRWHNYERQLAPVLSALEPLVTAFGYER